MQLTIENYRGVTGSATVELAAGKITLLAGLNGSGKSSILRAAAALLQADKQANGEILKDSQRIIHDGAEKAVIRLEAGEGNARQISYVPGNAEMVGDGPAKIGLSAAGLTRFSGLKPEERAATLIKVLNANPTEEDLVTAAKDCQLPQDLWKTISSLGWDAAHKEQDQERLNTGRKWQEVTGKPKYGRKEAEKWEPQEYDVYTLDSASVELLTKAVNEARDDQSLALKAEATNDVEKARLSDLVANIPALETDLAEIDQLLKMEEANLVTAKAYMTSLPPVNKAENCASCPFCKAEVAGRMVENRLELFVPDSQALKPGEVKVREAELLKQSGKVRGLESKIQDLALEHRQIREDLKAAAAAATKLREMKSITSAKTVEQAKQDLLEAETNLRAFNKMTEARFLHAKIQNLEKVCGLLAPDGLRQIALTKKLLDFNQQTLRPLCKTAHWYHVIIREDMSITYGGRAYADISGGQQFAVDATIQASLAILQKSPIVLLDKADVLDQHFRQGLIKMLLQSKLAALIGMMAFSADKVPNLAAVNLGITYWLNQGAVEAIKATEPVPA